LNLELYKCHIQAANEWDHIWHIIHTSVNDSVNKEIEKKYMIIDRKINKLTLDQTRKPKTTQASTTV
jgi:hypothetical protein